MGTSKSVDSYESGPSLASRICKIERQVDNLDLKVDRLCQLANNLLERTVRQQTNVAAAAVPTPPTVPIVINRYRMGIRPRICHRHQRRRPTTRQRSSGPNSSPTTTNITSAVDSSTIDSSRTNPTLPIDVSNREFSRESLISLYWLFQDHLNSSRNASV